MLGKLMAISKSRGRLVGSCAVLAILTFSAQAIVACSDMSGAGQTGSPDGLQASASPAPTRTEQASPLPPSPTATAASQTEDKVASVEEEPRMSPSPTASGESRAGGKATDGSPEDKHEDTTKNEEPGGEQVAEREVETRRDQPVTSAEPPSLASQSVSPAPRSGKQTFRICGQPDAREAERAIEQMAATGYKISLSTGSDGCADLSVEPQGQGATGGNGSTSTTINLSASSTGQQARVFTVKIVSKDGRTTANISIEPA